MKKRAKTVAPPQAGRRSLHWLVRRIFTHPIWCYSPKQILTAVQRDWDGPVGTSARAILDKMAKEHTKVLTIEFSEKGVPFLEMECEARLPSHTPNVTGQGTRHLVAGTLHPIVGIISLNA